MSDVERRQLVSAERDARAAAETSLAALAKIETRYRSIAETTTEWVWACDVEGRHTYSNPTVQAILGYRPDEVLGGDAFADASGRSPEGALELPRLRSEEGGLVGSPRPVRHRDGSYRHLESNGIPIVGSTGELEGSAARTAT